MSHTEFYANYSENLDSVINDREEVVITRVGRESVVVVALDEYLSLKKLADSLQSPPTLDASREKGA